MRARGLLFTAVVLGGGCGMGGAEGGGADHLPTLGAGPYGKLRPTSGTPADEPYVVVDAAANLSDPTALAWEGGLRLYYTRTPRGDGAAEIWRADLPSVRELPAETARALAADQPWEGGGVRAPSVARLDDARLALCYEGAGGVGLATSDDGGVTWRKASAPVVADAGDPALLVLEDVWLVYVTRRDASGIWRAESHDGGATFTLSPEPVLRPRPDLALAFDREWLGEPAAVGGPTATGRHHVGLFYVGRAHDGQHAIGYAGSFDGLTFERFMNGDAILDPRDPDERGPTAVLAADRGLLFFSERRVQTTAIAVAVHP